MRMTIGVLATVAAAVLPAYAGSDCPAAVISAVEKSHSGAKTLACHLERGERTNLYEVKIRTAEGKRLELEIDSDGAILESAEEIPTTAVPAAALQALQAKYPDAKVREAERITGPDGDVAFEIEFTSGGRIHEITLTESGTLVETDDDDLGEGEADDADEQN